MADNRKIAVYHPNQEYSAALVKQFQARLPSHDVALWQADCAADYLIVWQPTSKVLQTPEIKLIFSLGAGVDAIVPQVRACGIDVPLIRLVEAGMADQMFEIALYALLYFSRDFASFTSAQRAGHWLERSKPKYLPFTTPVGILGLGALGEHVATKLSDLGYPVSGYSRRKKEITGVRCYDESQLDAFLNQCDVLINLLPLTEATKGILNTTLFNQLPRGAFLVNLARGEHLDEQAFLAAIESGQLSGGLLDVFQSEPLPQNHPFWQSEQIVVTPHIAALTLQDEAVSQIVDNIVAFEAGEPLKGVVDEKRGY